MNVSLLAARLPSLHPNLEPMALGARRSFDAGSQALRPVATSTYLRLLMTSLSQWWSSFSVGIDAGAAWCCRIGVNRGRRR